MGRARAERSETSLDALKLLAFAMAGDDAEGMFAALQRTVATEGDDEFTETVEHLLSRAGLTVHGRLPDGQVILRRDGIDPD